MDRTWMYNTKRAHPTFLKEAGKFVELVKAHVVRENMRGIFCPCKDCKNEILLQDPNEVLSHNIERGFKKGYEIWTFHGEVGGHNEEFDDFCFDDTENFIFEDMSQGTIPECGGSGIDNVGIDFDLEDMLRHVEPDVLTGRTRGLDNWEALEKAAKELRYDEAKGCDKDYTVLRSVLELLRLKAKHGWSDTSFNDLMDLLKVMLPKSNLLPTNTYQTKKLICPLSLCVQKIHACENHCILYHKEFADLDSCPTCGMSRYKTGNGVSDGEVVDQDALVDEKKKIPSMVMWYLPVKDRLKRLFLNRTDAELMRWHQEGRKNDGKIRHPADARQWKNFDALHPEFAKVPRNVRFALSMDGMNPFGDLSNTHNTWPMLLTMYNLPTWICQKRKYILLSVLIQGPKQPGINIDVFMELLMEDMQELWKEGLRMWNEYRKEHFTLCAIIFVTINDLPTNFSLSGQFKGKFRCLICIDKTSYKYLTSSTKGVYMRHRRSLPLWHRWPAMARLFDNTVENDLAPETRTGGSVFELTKDIKVVFGKPKKKAVKRKKQESNLPFKKHSIFFRYLDYWKDLEHHWHFIGHPSKTKDGLKSRTDLVNLDITNELHPKELPNGKIDIPSACYSLTLEEKKVLCRCLHSVKVQTGFSANVRKLVSLKDLTISGYNAHDCHKMSTVFLPIAIRAVKPFHTRLVITKLCYVFNRVSQKVSDPEELGPLQIFAIETACQLEMFFPPAYFNMMEHLILHIVPQIIEIGPLYLH
uniref:Transposon protein, putative, CACTA, En/Spm sub-class n=2 Tax=Oryza sativa subsp. japonica TaxID=39947 RepID=Q2R7F7_ORYSJ|nr:transposon protein, putative, CACTA, En/Spm sub-class [Oryza sativa Japonica Group]ABA92558.1 transposon protein, putative, CACTA, En/Spm sub-class [Oryza sativa Japonica Group]